MAIDNKILTNLPILMRSARKRADLSQVVVAQRLGLSQGGISKLEKGAMIPSAPLWFAFCELTGISPDSLSVGYLERHSPVRLESTPMVGGFKIPSRYRNNRGSKVRAMKPFLSFFEASLSKEKLKEYLSTKAKIDPDYLVDLDAQLNLNFNLDLMDTLITEGALSRNNLSAIAQGSLNPRTHGGIMKEFDVESDSIRRLVALLNNSRFYECNFKYGIENLTETRLDLSIRPEHHLNEFKYKDSGSLGDVLCSYKKSYFTLFANLSEKNSVEISERECHYRGADRCLYEVKIAG